MNQIPPEQPLETSGPGRHDPGRRGRGRRSGWPVTWVLIGVCVLMWGLQWATRVLTPYDLSTILGYAPALTQAQPWRVLTSGFVHAMPSPVHLLLNMYTLYLFGRMLEPLLGAWRFTVLFLASVLGGSAGVFLWGDPWVLVIGASGGIFGLFGAMFVFMRHFRNSVVPITVLIAINLAFGFLVGGIAWQAHLGGLATGAVVGLLMVPGLRPRL
ncbi:rhomboid family intramembrane serine protease [Kocuria tytonis]|uniref:Rhomboid family intramembrane serine protease n=1 Tax=Kocuria tytonis TaxID=2054280 RepID=A0A495A5S8_9MICC|nr:rhomboid family intramembrane serine protease [Kocuria tytonis]RKQ35173.1 rhomboid family intramembrane serine protease [Kocuria tytonis]